MSLYYEMELVFASSAVVCSNPALVTPSPEELGPDRVGMPVQALAVPWAAPTTFTASVHSFVSHPPHTAQTSEGPCHPSK